jgi:hypothetical protein
MTLLSKLLVSIVGFNFILTPVIPIIDPNAIALPDPHLF